jgi:hypothetical protein
MPLIPLMRQSIAILINSTKFGSKYTLFFYIYQAVLSGAESRQLQKKINIRPNSVSCDGKAGCKNSGITSSV